jgi:hypothetical protein
MSQIDWNSELKKIEREFSGLPPEPSPEQVRAKRAAEQRAHERKAQQAATLGATTRLIVVSLLAGAMNFWPYPRACGAGLFGYMGAETLIVAGGIWAAVWAWRGRLGKLHVLSLVLVAWGLAVIGAQILPRAGYLRLGETPARWTCSAPRP